MADSLAWIEFPDVFPTLPAARGRGWIWGEGPPSADLGLDDERYVDEVTNLVWKKADGVWINTGKEAISTAEALEARAEAVAAAEESEADRILASTHRVAAAGFANAAAGSADEAEAWAAAAMISALLKDILFDSAAAGVDEETGVADGKTFIVRSAAGADVLFTIYKNEGGVAVEIGKLPSYLYFQRHWPESDIPGVLASWEDADGALVFYVDTDGVGHFAGGVDKYSLGWEPADPIEGVSAYWGVVDTDGKWRIFEALVGDPEEKIAYYGDHLLPPAEEDADEDTGGEAVAAADIYAAQPYPVMRHDSALYNGYNNDGNCSWRMKVYPKIRKICWGFTHNRNFAQNHNGYYFSGLRAKHNTTDQAKLKYIAQMLLGENGAWQIVFVGFDWDSDDHDEQTIVLLVGEANEIQLLTSGAYHNTPGRRLEFQFSKTPSATGLSKPKEVTVGDACTYGPAWPEIDDFNIIHAWTRSTTLGPYRWVKWDIAQRRALYDKRIFDADVGGGGGSQVYIDPFPARAGGFHWMTFLNNTLKEGDERLLMGRFGYGGQWQDAMGVDIENGLVTADGYEAINPWATMTTILEAEGTERFRKLHFWEFEEGILSLLYAEFDAGAWNAGLNRFENAVPGMTCSIKRATIDTTGDTISIVKETVLEDGGIGVDDTSNATYYGGAQFVGSNADTVLIAKWDGTNTTLLIRKRVSGVWTDLEVLETAPQKRFRPQTPVFYEITGGVLVPRIGDMALVHAGPYSDFATQDTDGLTIDLSGL